MLIIIVMSILSSSRVFSFIVSFRACPFVVSRHRLVCCFVSIVTSSSFRFRPISAIILRHDVTEAGFSDSDVCVVTP